MEKACISCKHFRDGHMSRTYITPRCKVRHDDAAMWMRANLCGLEGRLWQPIEQPAPSADTATVGSKPEPAI